MSSNQDETALQVARNLTQTLEDVRTELASVNKRAVRNKRVLWAITACLILLVGLSIPVAIIAVQSSNASSQAQNAARQARIDAERTRAQDVASCRQGNAIRSAEVTVWKHIATLTLTPDTPAAQRRSVTGLLNYIEVRLAPRNCAGL